MNGMLPIVVLPGVKETYFEDERLGELRNTKDFMDKESIELASAAEGRVEVTLKREVLTGKEVFSAYCQRSEPRAGKEFLHENPQKAIDACVKWIRGK